MKYLYPYECEKHNLSTMEELNAAIDGNRRDSRNIQSPPTSPILNPGGAFGMPFHPGFGRPPYGFDGGMNKFGVFGFPGMPGVNPMGFQPSQHGMLQTAKNITTSGKLKSPNFDSAFKYYEPIFTLICYSKKN